LVVSYLSSPTAAAASTTGYNFPPCPHMWCEWENTGIRPYTPPYGLLLLQGHDILYGGEANSGDCSVIGKPCAHFAPDTMLGATNSGDAATAFDDIVIELEQLASAAGAGGESIGKEKDMRESVRDALFRLKKDPDPTTSAVAVYLLGAWDKKGGFTRLTLAAAKTAKAAAIAGFVLSIA
jgi:hypothetical protein